MRSTNENKLLTIYLEGEINSSNAEEVEKEIDEIFSQGGFNEIKLDLSKLTYISSAGLRVIVRLIQNFKNTSIINVPDDIYDIFEMVGFTRIFTIKK